MKIKSNSRYINQNQSCWAYMRFPILRSSTFPAGAYDPRPTVGAYDPLSTSGVKSSFAIFQTVLTECVAQHDTRFYSHLDKHCHKGSSRSAISGVFMYRGICGRKSSPDHYLLLEKARLRRIVVELLQIAPDHLHTIDALLRDIQSFDTSISTTQHKLKRSASLVASINDKLQSKRLLSIAIECINCELETMSTLQYDLLRQVMLEERSLQSCLKNGSESLKVINDAGLNVQPFVDK